jgi:N-acetylmuramoyl-L-alanine amidase
MMSGDDVKQVQTILGSLRLYSAKIDGVFGTQTDKAVRAFQADFKLTIDGVVGEQTWGVLNKLAALARIDWWEARGENEKCQLAVCNVVLNRVRDTRWPNTIEEVISQKAQFTHFGKIKSARSRIHGISVWR